MDFRKVIVVKVWLSSVHAERDIVIARIDGYTRVLSASHTIDNYKSLVGNENPLPNELLFSVQRKTDMLNKNINETKLEGTHMRKNGKIVIGKTLICHNDELEDDYKKIKIMNVGIITDTFEENITVSNKDGYMKTVSAHYILDNYRSLNEDEEPIHNDAMFTAVVNHDFKKIESLEVLKKPYARLATCNIAEEPNIVIVSETISDVHEYTIRHLNSDAYDVLSESELLRRYPYIYTK